MHFACIQERDWHTPPGLLPSTCRVLLVAYYLYCAVYQGAYCDDYLVTVLGGLDLEVVSTADLADWAACAPVRELAGGSRLCTRLLAGLFDLAKLACPCLDEREDLRTSLRSRLLREDPTLVLDGTDLNLQVVATYMWDCLPLGGLGHVPSSGIGTAHWHLANALPESILTPTDTPEFDVPVSVMYDLGLEVVQVRDGEHVRSSSQVGNAPLDHHRAELIGDLLPHDGSVDGPLSRHDGVVDGAERASTGGWDNLSDLVRTSQGQSDCLHGNPPLIVGWIRSPLDPWQSTTPPARALLLPPGQLAKHPHPQHLPQRKLLGRVAVASATLATTTLVVVVIGI